MDLLNYEIIFINLKEFEKLFIASLELKILKDANGSNFESFTELDGLPIVAFSVLHGLLPDYESMCYLIGGNKQILYISDVKKIPDKVLEELIMRGPFKLMIIDALFRKPATTHFSLGEAVELARLLKPLKTRIVGMSCWLGMHDEVNKELHEENIDMDISLAFDGEIISGFCL